MDLNQLPKWATNFKYRKQNAYIMGLCLTYHVNLGLSLRKTAEALKEIHNVDISHTMVANYARIVAAVIKPFVDSYDYKLSDTMVADETYIKVKGIKGYVWFIMDSISRSILGYQVSDNRDVGPCILAMRMAFRNLKELPKKFRFIADGYGNDDDAYYGVSLWVAYYNFLRPHKIHNRERPLNQIEMLTNAGNMPGKWQLLIFFGQQTILHMQENPTA